jgi:hypothetical protein
MYTKFSLLNIRTHLEVNEYLSIYLSNLDRLFKLNNFVIIFINSPVLCLLPKIFLVLRAILNTSTDNQVAKY